MMLSILYRSEHKGSTTINKRRWSSCKQFRQHGKRSHGQTVVPHLEVLVRDARDFHKGYTGDHRVGAKGQELSTAGITAASINFADSACRKRFFHENSCDAGTPRSRQNAATLLPLSTCSTSPRHLAAATAPRSLIPQA